MDIALWFAQILLAIVYGMAGLIEVFQTEKLRERVMWARAESSGSLRLVGVCELLGAASMILPLLTSVLFWLVPLAAMGLALVQLLAILTVHLPRNEYNILPLNVILLALSIFVTFGRWELIVSSFPFL